MKLSTQFRCVFLVLWWCSVVGQEAVVDTPNSPGESTKMSSEAVVDTTVESTKTSIEESCSADDETCIAAAVEKADGRELPLCADDGDEADCAAWAEVGECEKNPVYMKLHCRKSCNLCDDDSLNLLLGEDIGVIQTVTAEQEDEILTMIRSTRKYLNETVYKELAYDKIKSFCRLRDESCSYWAVVGECEHNAAFMNTTCAPSCRTCEFLDMRQRCPMDPNATNVWEPGDLNKMFERIISDPEYKKYEPNILSRPELLPGDTAENATYLVGPWVITLENFLTPEEAQRLIELGGDQGYKRSGGVGKLNFDGTIESDIVEMRTSENAWCSDECYNDPIAKQVMERLRNITDIPDGNTEFLQLLRYQVGQFYKTHHDYIDYERDRPGGVRILTLFMYLNEVEAGGGTNFPELNLTVVPKLGRAVLWPSVFNDQPHSVDERTSHQALPVEKGIKYGANAWMHQRDFKKAYARNCN